jgi:ribosomal protein L22
VQSPHLDEYKKAPAALMKQTAKKEKKEPEAEMIARGVPSQESIFARDDEPAADEEKVESVEKPLYEEIDPEALMNVLDPVPAKRLAWQRKKVIQQIRKRGELTKAEIIKRTERECVASSAMFKSSTKKLVHLARQIAGKPIDEAIVQMQLSKKRIAQDIMRHLEYSKNLAVVSRGMGLGNAEERQGEPVEIELKDGKRQLITDKTGIYVDQAWVNKGDESITPDYRGRGRVFTHTHRRASKSRQVCPTCGVLC